MSFIHVRHKRYKGNVIFGEIAVCSAHMNEMEPVRGMDVMHAYSWLSECGFDAEKIRSYVINRTGLLLPISWPGDIYVRIVDVFRFSYFLQKWSAVCEEGKFLYISVQFELLIIECIVCINKFYLYRKVCVLW